MISGYALPAMHPIYLEFTQARSQKYLFWLGLHLHTDESMLFWNSNNKLNYTIQRCLYTCVMALIKKDKNRAT